MIICNAGLYATSTSDAPKKRAEYSRFHILDLGQFGSRMGAERRTVVIRGVDEGSGTANQHTERHTVGATQGGFNVGQSVCQAQAHLAGV